MITGKVVHIDFGDCFESTQLRAKFPEKVPFRLTRMLTTAMEASGIEGTFRSTCEIVMGVLHDNRDSVQAMLEAFQYDPLVSWKGKGEKAITSSINQIIPVPLVGDEGVVLDNIALLAQPQFTAPDHDEIAGAAPESAFEESEEPTQERSNEIAMKNLKRIQAK